MGLGPTQPNDLHLMPSAKILFLNKVTFTATGGLGTSTGEGGETEFDPQRVPPNLFLLQGLWQQLTNSCSFL